MKKNRRQNSIEEYQKPANDRYPGETAGEVESPRGERPVRSTARPGGESSPTLPSYNQPYWVKLASGRRYPALMGESRVDVAVIGAGITGLTTALILQRAGRRVAVLDMHMVGGGTTGHSTGHIDSMFDQGMARVLSNFGADGARIILGSKRSAITFIERAVSEFDLKCDFRLVPGYLYAETDDQVFHLEDEYRAAVNLGYDLHLTDRLPLPFRVRKAMVFPHQARLAPLQYVAELARVFTITGGDIYEQSRVISIDNDANGGRVVTENGAVLCSEIVLAGHAPLLGPFSVQSRAYPYQSYVIGARVADSIEDALFWDVADPYHYIRRASDADGNLYLIGGNDHHTGEVTDTSARFSDLEMYARDRFQVNSIEYRWSHEYFDTPDGVPYIGRLPGDDHIYVATGFAGDGLTYGTTAAILISDLIMNQPNPGIQVFAPSRIKPIASAGRYIKGAGQVIKHWLGDRLAGGDVESLDQIPRGEGAVVHVNGERLAVYHDFDDTLHSFSPVCRHLGCIVHFNSAEKTWDCACHGGRYDQYGVVIGGPPRQPLEPKPLPKSRE